LLFLCIAWFCFGYSFAQSILSSSIIRLSCVCLIPRRKIHISLSSLWMSPRELMNKISFCFLIFSSMTCMFPSLLLSHILFKSLFLFLTTLSLSLYLSLFSRLPPYLFIPSVIPLPSLSLLIRFSLSSFPHSYLASFFHFSPSLLALILSLLFHPLSVLIPPSLLLFFFLSLLPLFFLHPYNLSCSPTLSFSRSPPSSFSPPMSLISPLPLKSPILLFSFSTLYSFFLFFLTSLYHPLLSFFTFPCSLFPPSFSFFSFYVFSNTAKEF